MVHLNPSRKSTQKPVESAGDTAVNGADAETGRERVMRAAYDLFSRHGTRAIGVDAVIGEAGVAKMTLYRTSPPKMIL